MEYVSRSPEETEQIASYLVRRWRPGTLVLLNGKFGAGKTTFVRGALRALGFRGRVVSPSFLIRKSYQVPGISRQRGGRKKLRAGRWSLIRWVHHLDGYRLKRRSELTPLGLDEVLADRRSLTFVEWPRRFHRLFRGRPHVRIWFRVTGTVRRLVVSPARRRGRT